MDRRDSGAGIDSFAMRRDSPPNEDAIVVVFGHSPLSVTARRTAEAGKPPVLLIVVDPGGGADIGDRADRADDRSRPVRNRQPDSRRLQELAKVHFGDHVGRHVGQLSRLTGASDGPEGARELARPHFW
jgi:hypothetical protein